VILRVLLSPVLFGVCACSPGLDLEPLRSPLRVAAAASALASDLDVFVPAAMARAGVPGVSVAVVQDGAIVFSAGYGVADVLTRRPVTPRTVFEVASNSKPVVAYAALALVDAGVLALDAPAAAYVEQPRAEHERVTLRQLLSHSSGLSNLGVGVFTDHRVWFRPGERFSYSGHGYELLGRVLENATGEPLAAHLERVVLEPLGMQESGYRLEGSLAEHLAHPHLPAWTLAAGALVLVLLATIPIFGLGGLVPRLLGLRKRPRARSLAAASLLAGAVLGSLLLGSATALAALLLLGLLVALPGTAFLAARRLRRARGGGAAARVLLASAASLGLALAGFVITRPAVPLPKRQLDIVAAGGLLATAPDLARFLAELMAPTGLPPEPVRTMISPQVRIDGSLSWGLGIGIRRGESADAIWHWGQNPGFESLMIGYPSEQLGVVVLTNGGPGLAGLALAREIAHRAIGGDHGSYWMAVPGTGLPSGAGR
jgi:CubicO group peptidase (beta-lactamase class C family)